MMRPHRPAVIQKNSQADGRISKVTDPGNHF
jgi:hypothetical protein